MSRLVPRLLSEGYQNASDVLNALLFKGVLNESGRGERNCEAANCSAFDAAPLFSVSSVDLVRHSTPFLWLNVRRLLGAYRDNQDTIEALSLRRYFSMALLDALYHFTPDGFTVRLRGTPVPPVVLLPRLGVQVRTGSCDAIVVRRSAATLTIDTPEKSWSLNLEALSPDTRLKALPVSCFPGCQLLTVRDPALFEAQYIEEILPEGLDYGRFSALISDALKLIETVDPNLQTRISEVVRWYVPIRSPKAEIHCSFTSPQLKGVIFLSYTQNRFALAEAIVHEFGHTELNTIMDTESVVLEDPSERFYSPWRRDPRPLSGLLHALYVFSGVIEFLTRALTSPIMVAERKYLEGQRVAIYHKLRIGLKQVPEQRLTLIGREIIEDIRRCLSFQESDLSPGIGQVPAHIYQHLEAWKSEHPELASAVRMP
jgi:HEXXH motif-containing protein